VSSTDFGGRGDRHSGRIWRFGDCEFDEPRRDLRVRGVTVNVEVKPLEVLHQLLLHAGEVVTKTELLEAVWPGVMVVDGSLATAVSKLRKLLGDNSNVIVTVPRVGYKLAAPVKSESVSAPIWPDLHLDPGDSVPHREQWRLVRRLDLSPSSEVWLAEHPKTHEVRVFKFALDHVRLKGLKREVTVARLLRESLGERDDFVRVLEWNFEHHPFFIETEYAGPNLAEWAEGAGGIGSVPLNVRVKLLADVARALAAGHSVDVLHKDLKPGNILVAPRSGSSPRIKIADFGSASLLAPARLSAFGITNLGFTQSAAGGSESLSGTVTYLAPEVLTGQSPTAASDVYALGVLLYQLVVGDFRRPFAPGWERDVADPLIRDDIVAAAAGDPSRRFASAAELAGRLSSLESRRREHDEMRQREQEDRRRQASVVVRRRWLAAAGLVIVAAGAIAGIVSWSRTDPRPLRTVAVLSFHNAGADSTGDFLRLALPDQITTVLSRARGLRVRPFSTTSAYQQPEIDIERAGRETRADTLLAGRFRKAGDQLHITLEAIDVPSQAILWRDNFDARIDNMIGTRTQLVLRVQGNLLPLLGGVATDPLAEPRNEEAYELYLKSSALGWEGPSNVNGITMLERAVTLDPAYAPAWLTLGRRYYAEAHWAGGNSEMLPRYVAAMERAAALDPDDVATAAAVVVSRIERGDLVSAHEQAQQLVRRRADNVAAQFVLSYALRYAGLLEESASHCDKAFLIDPLPVNTSLRTCAIVFFVRSDYTRALNYLNLDQESETGKAFRLDLLVRQSENEQALKLGVPDVPEWRAKYEMLLACVQRRPSAEIELLARAVVPAADPEENYLSAAHLSYCGQTDAARALLMQAIQRNYCSYPAMESDPLFERVRATPEYAAVRAAGESCQRRFVTARGLHPQQSSMKSPVVR
jgi:DNA-binding winged helix-turn-helix (wHTH) protein/serine/threonine protein kinase